MASRYGRHGIRWSKQIDYTIILELNSQYPIKTLCEIMNVKRDGFYKWINRNSNPHSPQAALRAHRMALFKIYSEKYKTHGYRWLNAKIKLDNADFKCSNLTAHRICKHLGIKSKAKHETNKYRKPRTDSKNYNNLILNKIAPSEPFKVVVSDMTAMKYKGNYYEVTWYMDLFNNEIISFGVSNRHGDSQTYYDGLDGAIFKKQQGYQDFITILHTNCGSVYTSNSYNSKLYLNGFIHSTSTPGNPTENGAMESINGWTKEELLRDFMIAKGENIKDALENYIYYFNNERPASALNYLTPMQYKENFYKNTKLLPAKITDFCTT